MSHDDTLRNKKILMIAPAPFLIERGKSLRIDAHLKALSETGAHIDLLTYPDGRDSSPTNTTLMRASRLFRRKEPGIPGVVFVDLLSNVQLFFKALYLLLTRKYHLIYCHDVDGAFIGAIAKKVSLKETPLIYDMHGVFAELARYYNIFFGPKLIRWTEGFLYANSDHIIINWPHIRELIEAEVPQTLIMDRPDKETYDLLISKEKDSVEPYSELKYVLYTGNSADYQRLDLLLESLKYLPKDIHMVLAGRIERKYEIDDTRVHYVGYLKGQRLVDLMKSAQGLVSTRMTDGFPPMKILYYLLTDKPIVATRAGCHTSILKNEEGVIICDPSPAHIADAILKSAEMKVDRGDKWKELLKPKRVKEELESICLSALRK